MSALFFVKHDMHMLPACQAFPIEYRLNHVDLFLRSPFDYIHDSREFLAGGGEYS